MGINIVPQGIILNGRHYTTDDFNERFVCHYMGIDYSINHYDCDSQTIYLIRLDTISTYTLTFKQFSTEFSVIDKITKELYCAADVRIVSGGLLYKGKHYYSDEFNDEFAIRSKSSGQILEICTRSFGVGVTDGATFSMKFNPDIHEIVRHEDIKADPTQNMMQMIALLASQNHLLAQLTRGDLDRNERLDTLDEIKRLEGMISHAYLEVYPNED